MFGISVVFPDRPGSEAIEPKPLPRPSGASVGQQTEHLTGAYMDERIGSTALSEIDQSRDGE
jgi:hypothetical protein